MIYKEKDYWELFEHFEDNKIIVYEVNYLSFRNLNDAEEYSNFLTAYHGIARPHIFVEHYYCDFMPPTINWEETKKNITNGSREAVIDDWEV